MKFSFIIPTKNEEKYIKKCLESLKRHGKDSEIIVIDSSSDRTLGIARKYTKNAFLERHSGVSIAKNSGARRAKGEYLIFLDADSFLAKGFMEKLEKELEKGDIAGGVARIRLCDSNNVLEDIFCSFWNNFVRVSNFIRVPITSGCLLVCKKSVFRQVKGFDEKLVAAEDHDLARKIAARGRFVFFSEPLVMTSARRIHRLGMTRFFYLQFSNSIKYFLFGKSEESYWK